MQLLLLLSVCLRCVHSRVSVSVSPVSSQFFEYDHVSLSCEQPDSEDWTVWRYTADGQKLSACGSSWGDWTASTCQLQTAKPRDSGVYWCQSRLRDSGSVVNISVTDRPVVLQSPVLPLVEGEDVTLRCRTNKSSSHPAAFYRDESLIRSESAGLLTLHNFSRSDQGAYRCVIDGQSSATSWLLVKDGSEPASLTASPDSAQLFEYANLVLSCGDNSSSSGWRIVRSTSTASADKISSCGGKWGTPTASGCRLMTAKQHDSATYWCESPAKQRSNSLDIMLYDKAVILESPVLPVVVGENITLRCKTKSSSNLLADFYKNGSFIGRGVEGHMTLHRVSRSDDGLYSCMISGAGESATSRLLVRDPRGAVASAARWNQLLLMVMRHLLVACPYCFATARLLCVCRGGSSGRKQPVSMAMAPTSEEYDQYDDVDADVTTEHHF